MLLTKDRMHAGCVRDRRHLACIRDRRHLACIGDRSRPGRRFRVRDLRTTLILIAFLFTGFVVSGEEPNRCTDCHQSEHSEEQNAVHAREGVRCIDCHGGDATKTDKSAAHAGLSGKISRQNVPNLCATCHSDVRRMNPYGISTDQYAQYLTSKHGEELSKGNEDVATCIDCHNSHGIRQVRDTQSPVHPKNVPATCGRCHSDSALMSKYNLASDTETLYRQSIHAELLFEKDDLSAPTCATCHGNHGAVPPGLSQISHVCGKCHIKQQEFYLESPHAQFGEDMGFQSCITCHTNHKVLRTANEIFERCSDCHDTSDDAMKKRDAIFSVIRTAEKDYQETEKKLHEFTRLGYQTEDEQFLLEDAKTSMLQLPPAQHRLNIEEVKKVASKGQDVLLTINDQLEQKHKLENLKRFALVPIWLFLASMAVIFWARRRQFENEE